MNYSVMQEGSNRSDEPRSKSPLAFFLMAFALYVPFVMWANVRTFAVGAFLPVIAALILVYRENRTAGMVELLRRSFDYKRIKSRIWYLPILLLYPCLVFMQYGMALLSGVPVSSPQFSLWTLVGFALVFVLALGEELGWMGYAFDPMQERLGALKASLVLGPLWASVHIALFLGGGASSYWIAWQSIYIVATRVLFVWIYNNTGRSVFAVALLHTMFNFVWQVFPPGAGGLLVPSFYSPSTLALTTIVLAAIVTFLWGPETLARYRYVLPLALPSSQARSSQPTSIGPT